MWARQVSVGVTPRFPSRPGNPSREGLIHMASNIAGADVGQLKGLSDTYKAQAVVLAGLISALDGPTRDSRGFWTGPIALNFQDSWDQKDKKTFQNFVDALHKVSDDLKKTAENIANATGAHI